VKGNIRFFFRSSARVALKKEMCSAEFNYKENKAETYLGFVAEDVPDLVAMNDRKGINPMDMVAVLTKVVQEQQKALLAQQKSITELQKKISKIEGATPKKNKRLSVRDSSKSGRPPLPAG